MAKFPTKATSSELDKFKREISGRGVARAGKWLNLFISNKDVDDIIKIAELLEKSGLLIDGTTGTVRHEIKKQEGGYPGAMMTASLIIPIASSLIVAMTSLLINTITGKEVMRAEKGGKGGFLSLLVSLLMMKVLGKGITTAGRGYNNMDKYF